MLSGTFYSASFAIGNREKCGKCVVFQSNCRSNCNHFWPTPKRKLIKANTEPSIGCEICYQEIDRKKGNMNNSANANVENQYFILINFFQISGEVKMIIFTVSQ
jgi:hypothetical protein